MKKFGQVLVLLIIIFGMALAPISRANSQTAATHLAQRPVWSPDGTKILFESLDESNKTSLQIYDVTTAAVVNLPASEENPGFAQWSPDGTRIAYWTAEAEVWVVNADGSAPFNVTEVYHNVDSLFDWSPDGQALVIKPLTLNPHAPELDRAPFWIFELDEASAARTSVVALGYATFLPNWSPDGSQILVTNIKGGGLFSEILTFDVNTGYIEMLIEGDFEGAQWSPAGDAIALLSSKNCPSGYNIVLFDLATSKLGDALGQNCAATGFPLVWSPDGNYIAYQKSEAVFGIIEIASGQEILEVAGQNPSWSPNSTKIAFDAYQNDPSTIWILDIATAQVTPL